MSESEDLTFPSGEDTCAAWLYRPYGAAGAVPCVVMAHGFTATRGDRLPPYPDRFAAAGLAVLLFDYRHFGDSTGMPRQLLDIGRQQADYHAAVAFARTVEGIDAQRIGLFGTSFSGGHVDAVAAQDPSIAAVVSQCPFADGLAALRVVPPRGALRATARGRADQPAPRAAPPRWARAPSARPGPAPRRLRWSPSARPGRSPSSRPPTRSQAS